VQTGLYKTKSSVTFAWWLPADHTRYNAERNPCPLLFIDGQPYTVYYVNTLFCICRSYHHVVSQRQTEEKFCFLTSFLFCNM